MVKETGLRIRWGRGRREGSRGCGSGRRTVRDTVHDFMSLLMVCRGRESLGRVLSPNGSSVCRRLPTLVPHLFHGTPTSVSRYWNWVCVLPGVSTVSPRSERKRSVRVSLPTRPVSWDYFRVPNMFHVVPSTNVRPTVPTTSTQEKVWQEITLVGLVVCYLRHKI